MDLRKHAVCRTLNSALVAANEWCPTDGAIMCLPIGNGQSTVFFSHFSFKKQNYGPVTQTQNLNPYIKHKSSI